MKIHTYLKRKNTYLPRKSKYANEEYICVCVNELTVYMTYIDI